MPLGSDPAMEDFEEISVMDVYDIVTEFAKEFRPIIDIYGPDPLNNIMSRVVTILEHLEAQAVKIGKLNSLLQEREGVIVKLERDKVEKAADRQRFEKELEQIEEHWREESREMVAVINRLQEENRKLTRSLAAKQDNPSDYTSQPMSPEVDVGVLQRSRASIEKLRDQMKAKDKEIQSRNSEIENLNDQVTRLSALIKDLKKKYKVCQGQVRSLIDERADFITQLQDKQHELMVLRQRLGIAQKENEDLSQSHIEKPDLTNKAVYDLDDPNRPRFTTDELKEILRERNEFKARVSDLEDELSLYRPKCEESFYFSSRSPMDEVDNQFHLTVLTAKDLLKKKKKMMLLCKDQSLLNLMMLLGKNQSRVLESFFASCLVKQMSHFLEAALNGVYLLFPRWLWRVELLSTLLFETVMLEPCHLITVSSTGCFELIYKGPHS